MCQVEEKMGDRGKIAKASGNYATVIAHNTETKKTRVKLPSGSKKVSRTKCVKDRKLVGKEYMRTNFLSYFPTSLIFSCTQENMYLRAIFLKLLAKPTLSLRRCYQPTERWWVWWPEEGGSISHS